MVLILWQLLLFEQQLVRPSTHPERGLNVTQCLIEHNGNDGVGAEIGLGNITLFQSSASFNGANGIWSNSGNGGDIVLTSSNVSENQNNGIIIEGASTDTSGTLSLTNSTLLRNAGWSSSSAAIRLLGHVGEISIVDSDISANRYGIYALEGQASASNNARPFRDRPSKTTAPLASTSRQAQLIPATSPFLTPAWHAMDTLADYTCNEMLEKSCWTTVSIIDNSLYGLRLENITSLAIDSVLITGNSSTSSS